MYSIVNKTNDVNSIGTNSLGGIVGSIVTTVKEVK